MIYAATTLDLAQKPSVRGRRYLICAIGHIERPDRVLEHPARPVSTEAPTFDARAYRSCVAVCG